MGLRQMFVDEGAQQAFKYIVNRRFGQIPPWVEKRMQNATRQDMENWIDRILDGDSIDKVFNA